MNLNTATSTTITRFEKTANATIIFKYNGLRHWSDEYKYRSATFTFK